MMLFLNPSSKRSIEERLTTLVEKMYFKKFWLCAVKTVACKPRYVDNINYLLLFANIKELMNKRSYNNEFKDIYSSSKF